jgi:hypothetical protein
MYKTILFLSLLSYSSLAFGQQLSAQTGAIPTHFVFTMEGDTLPITDQYLLKRAAYQSDGGYESFHLEFASRGPLSTTQRIRSNQHLTFTFYGADDQQLGRISKNPNIISAGRDASDNLYFYNIDLISIPFTLFYYTHRIEITF